tara:strand:- start:136 stop:561 length:426 start_codon:yes stop_codon:yes gene_type:complete
MALIGGGGAGGAGNVAGSNPAGIGSSLNYIGNHVYANSGTYEASTSSQTVLEFTTGNNYIVGTLQLNSAVQFSNASVRQSAAKISYDSQTIALIVGSAEDAPVSQTTDILIPPFTNVKVEVISAQGDSDNFTTVSIVGRVY